MAKKVKLFSITILALALFLAACNKDDANEVTENEPEPVEETETEEELEPAFVFPYTGLPTDTEPNHRPIAVMINNHPAARPQSGLDHADLVYEVLAEGGVTRFLAVFQSEMPEKFGPVRSARDYYVYLAEGLGAIYVHHGWSPDAENLIKQGVVESINGLFYDGSLFKRADFRKAPHNSYITYENVIKGAEQLNYSLEATPDAYLFIGEDEEVGGTEKSSTTIDYSTKTFEVRFEYDTSLGKYVRYSADEQTTDLESGNPILLDNIFIVETNHQTIDDVGRLAVDLQSGGRGLLLQQGKVQEVEWRNVNGRIAPFSGDTELAMVPGKTWVNFVPSLDIVN